MFETFERKTVTVVALILAFAFVYSYVSDDASSGTGYPVARNFALTGGSNLAGNNTNHTECRGLSCVIVNGTGQNECANNRDCIRIAKANKTRINMTHTECDVYPNGVGYCKVVAGPGNNQCNTLNNGYADCNRLDCVPSGSNSTNGTCLVVPGMGADRCWPINSSC